MSYTFKVCTNRVYCVVVDKNFRGYPGIGNPKSFEKISKVDVRKKTFISSQRCSIKLYTFQAIVYVYIYIFFFF